MRMSTKSISILTGLLVALAGASGCSTLTSAASSAANAAGANVPSIEEHELKPSDISSDLEGMKDKELLTIRQKHMSKGEMKKASESSEDEMKKTSGDSKSSSEAPETINYISVGSSKKFKKYDKLFRKTAELKGLVVLTRNFVQASEDAIQSGFVDSVKSGKIFKKALGQAADVSPKSRRKIVQLTIGGRFNQIPKKVKGITKKNFESFKKSLFSEYPSLETTVKVGPVVVKNLKPKRITKRVQKMVKLGERLGKEAPQKFKGPEAALVPRLTKELTQSVKQLKQTAEQTPKLAKEMKSLADTSMKAFKGKSKSTSM